MRIIYYAKKNYSSNFNSTVQLVDKITKQNGMLYQISKTKVARINYTKM